MTSNRLVEMDTFVRIAQNQNFVAAAAELGVSPAFITRRLQTLEQALEVRLVSRTTRRISLTEAGRKYYEFSKRILKEIQQEESMMKQGRDEPAGRITVLSPVSFGIMEMGKAVTEFMVQYPLIQITLIIGDNRQRTYDPSEYGADVVIRFARSKATSLYARNLGRISWILCASRGYLRKAGTPDVPGDLTRHSCLVTSKPFGDGTWKLKGPKGVEKIKISGVVSPSSAITMRYMALDGAGIAFLPVFCVAEDIRKKRLVPILTDYSGAEQPIIAYYPHALQQPLNMRLFLQFLERRFKKATWGLGF